MKTRHAFKIKAKVMILKELFINKKVAIINKIIYKLIKQVDVKANCNKYKMK